MSNMKKVLPLYLCEWCVCVGQQVVVLVAAVVVQTVGDRL